MPKNPKATQTVLQHASGNSGSLRTTIPKFIIDTMGLAKGDMLEWRIMGLDNEQVVIVALPVVSYDPEDEMDGGR